MFLDNTYMAEDTELFNEDFGLVEAQDDPIIQESIDLTESYNESLMEDAFNGIMEIQEAAHEMNIGLLIAEHKYYVENGHYFTEGTDDKKDGKFAKAWGSVKDFFKRIGEILVKWWRQFTLKVRELWANHYKKACEKLKKSRDDKKRFTGNKRELAGASTEVKEVEVYDWNDFKTFINDKIKNKLLKITANESGITYSSDYSDNVDKDKALGAGTEENVDMKNFKESFAGFEKVKKNKVNVNDTNKIDDLIKQLEWVTGDANNFLTEVKKVVSNINNAIKDASKLASIDKDEKTAKAISKAKRGIRRSVSQLMLYANKILSCFNKVAANYLSAAKKALGNYSYKDKEEA